MDKTCTLCRSLLPVSEFYVVRRKGREYLDPRCKKCRGITTRAWHKANWEKMSKTVKTRKQILAKVARSFVNEYLESHPCVDCGERDYLVLQFDHVIKSKRHVTHMVTAGLSTEAIQREINKCQVRCANCHVRRHRLRGFTFSDPESGPNGRADRAS